jgi:hypothetical protein
MKSPGYRAAPHEWGWAWGVVSRIDPALRGSPDIDVRAVGRDEAGVVGRNRPAMKSPGYQAAPHEWGWAWSAGLIRRCVVARTLMSGRLAATQQSVWRWEPPGDEVAGLPGGAP